MCHRAYWLLAPRAWLPTEIPRDRVFPTALESAGELFILFFKNLLGTPHKKNISSLTQGSNPHPLEWKHRVLTSGSPGKSLYLKKKF